MSFRTSVFIAEVLFVVCPSHTLFCLFTFLSTPTPFCLLLAQSPAAIGYFFSFLFMPSLLHGAVTFVFLLSVMPVFWCMRYMTSPPRLNAIPVDVLISSVPRLLARDPS
uniref:Transmembrane protein n=1 Tax=Trypanosoma vivax (strain Y486) TaxID=1055687 RepID=G0U397_TRYVY|nr:hypothetical protein TVY486_0905740 [Trypanosoma vivax Y486]